MSEKNTVLVPINEQIYRFVICYRYIIDCKRSYNFVLLTHSVYCCETHLAQVKLYFTSDININSECLPLTFWNGLQCYVVMPWCSKNDLETYYWTLTPSTTTTALLFITEFCTQRSRSFLPALTESTHSLQQSIYLIELILVRQRPNIWMLYLPCYVISKHTSCFTIRKLHTVI